MKHLAFAVVLLSSVSCQAAGFQPWTDFAEAKFKGTKLWRENVSNAYCYVTGHSRIDADGAPNAYHPADAAKKQPPYFGLDNPSNAGWPKTNWWSSVLVPDPTKPSQPYQQPSGPHKGYFVSQTALKVKGGDRTAPSSYADSRHVPYIVLPGSKFPLLKGTGAAGDVGVAWNLANGRQTAFVIGDTGGGADARLGEGSIALFKALGAVDINARTGAGVVPAI